MMKMMTGMVLLLFYAFITFAQPYEQLPFQKDKKYENLKAKVVAVTERTYVPSKDSVLLQGATVIRPDATWTLEHSEELQLDSMGRILHITVSDLEDRKKNRMKISGHNYFYQKGRMIAQTDTEGKERKDSIAFHYKRSGQLEYYTAFNSKNNVLHKVTYAYDRDGRIITVRKKNEDNYPVAMIKHKYNGIQLQESQYFDQDFKQTESRRYSSKKSEDGRVNISYVVMNMDGSIKEGMSWVKDADSNILEQSTINSERKVTDYRHFKYDEQGEQTEERVFSASQELTISGKFVYDEKGNWIRKEVYHNDRLQSLVERTLTYRE